MRVTKFTSSFLLAASFVLTGCASSGLGNYANVPMPASNSMAENTVSQLAALYPPGSTTFSLKQPAKDAFGSVLIQRLRGRGYAVKEFTPEKKAKGTLTTTPGTTLGYVVNTVAPNLYQVTTYVGNVSLSRGFIIATDNKAYPAGPWAREE